MSETTGIEWTDSTWNPIRGCSRVSEGCRHCYAEVMAARFSGPGQPYEGLARLVQKPDGRTDARWTGAIVLASERTWRLPLHWNKPRRIFVNSMSDLFHENVPDEAIDRAFAIMAFCPQHTFQILTKRPERMRRYFQLDNQAFHDRQFEALSWVAERSRFVSVREAHEHHGLPWQKPTCAEDRWPLQNVWIGVSVEDQATANARIPYLLETPAGLRFLSCEPLLGCVDLVKAGALPPYPWPFFSPDAELCRDPNCGRSGPHYPREFNCRWGKEPIGLPGIDWVIVGGESGGKAARSMRPSWARILRDQCAAAGVPFFFKQWGEWAPALSDGKSFMLHSERSEAAIARLDPIETQESCVRVGKRRAGRDLDGRTHDAFPAVRHAH